MAMQFLRSSATGGFIKVILLGLLFMAVIGLVMMDFGNSFRHGLSNNDVAQIENRSVNIQDFDRMLRMALQKYNMTPQQAYKYGYLREILNTEIKANLVAVEAEKLGINVSRDEIQRRIAENIEPIKNEGETLQETLDRIIQIQGISEKYLVDSVKREISVDLLTQAILSSASYTSPELAQDLYQFQGQARDIEVIAFPNEDIKNIVPPTEEQLKAAYEVEKNTIYSIPEQRSVNFAFLDKSKIGADIVVSDSDAKAAYEEHKDKYKTPEQYVMTQIGSQDEAKINEVFKETTDGKSLKDAVIKVMGDDKSLIQHVPFDITLLPEEIQKSVKEKKAGDIVGPIKTALGFQIVQIEEINPASIPAFEALKTKIINELKESQKTDLIYDASTTFDELLERKTPFEEIAKEVPLTITSVPSLRLDGRTKDGKDAFEAINDKIGQDMGVILDSVFKLQKNETSRLLELKTGEFIAIEIQDILEKSSKPFNEIKNEMIANFTQKAKIAENAKITQSYIDDLNKGKIKFGEVAAKENKYLKTVKDIKLATQLDEPLTEAIKPKIFENPVNSYFVETTEKDKILIHVKAIHFPELDDNAKTKIEGIKDNLNAQSGEDMFLSFIETLNKKYVARTNEALLKQVYGKEESAAE